MQQEEAALDGGSINIFTKEVINAGELSAKGGAGGYVSGCKNLNHGSVDGGNGGDGTVTINEVGQVLNYPEKEIILHKGDNYLVDKNLITYTKLNENQTENLTVGDIIYGLTEGNNIQIDQDGNISAGDIGTAKVKIVDETNKYSTYIIVKVIDNVAVADLKNGNNHMVALKENGTVWQTGVDDNGLPVELTKEDDQDLENIIKIDAGENTGIALDKDGNVYTWNVGDKAKKVDGLNNIRAVSAKNGAFYAVDKSGKAYIWGDGTSGIQEITSSLKYIDVNGENLLGENGRVYRVDMPEEPVQFLNNICEISDGEDEVLYRTLLDRAYDIEKDAKYTELVRKETGILEGIRDISVGSSARLLLDKNGTVYLWGENKNNKLGSDVTNAEYPVELTKVQDMDRK